MPRRPMGATCLTLPSCPPTWARSAVLTNSACRSWVNGSSPVVRCWPAGSSRPTSSPGGVAAADARLRRATACPGGWRTNRWSGARRRCWSRSAAIAAPAVGMCRARTPAGPPGRGRSCRVALRWALDGTLKRRAVDVLAYFDRPGPPTGRPRRSTAASNTFAAQPPGFRNLTNYIARSPLETGGFRPRLHPRS